MFRHLSITEILAWADAFHEQMGRWPTKACGRIAGTVCETWAGVDRALRLGLLGLPGGSTLARLLSEHRGARCATYTPPLSIEQILDWADAHFRATGDWPTTGSARVLDVPRERWDRIDEALRQGSRGLPGGSSLARLLAEHRGTRNHSDLPPFTIDQILAWIDAFHQRTGKWPNERSGPIPDSGGETWLGIETALQRGSRGLPGGSSIPRLLAQYRGVRNKTNLPLLTIPDILAWADARYQRTGQWPNVRSGPILEAHGETWSGVNAALERGTRGLPGGSSLARLLAAERGARNHLGLPRLSEKQILAWADAHFAQTGNWPGQHSGPILEAPAETWGAVDNALRMGLRGLPGGSSLAQLLAEERGKRNVKTLPPLQIREIVSWATAYRRCNGHWPTKDSGPIPEAPGESWSAVDTALRDGLRGLPGGDSLARLLARTRRKRNRRQLPPLTIEQILHWADRYHERTRSWPTAHSGSIPGTVGESWLTVDKALRRGRRGLPGGSSLADLLATYRGKRNLPGQHSPPLHLETIRLWAEACRQENGRLPSKGSGAIPAAPGETWLAVDEALRRGGRGLPGGSSLTRLLAQEATMPGAEVAT